MRFSLALAALLLSAVFCLAEPDINDSIKKTLVGQLNFTGNYSVSYFGLNGDNYGFITYTYVVTSGVGVNATNITKSDEIFVLNVSTANVSFVVDDATLDLLLRARNRWLLTDFAQEIRGDLTVFNRSRELEAKCKSSLGLDKALCWDVDSCLYRSCVYSQAMCLPFAQGNGKPFLESMAAFSKATVDIDLELNRLTSSLTAFVEKRTETLPAESAISTIETQVASIGGNNLFKPYSATTNGFEFCTPIPYRTDSLASAKLKLAQLRTKLFSDGTINTTKKRIIDETLRRKTGLEAALNKSSALLEQIKANARTEFSSTYEIIVNSSGTIVGKAVDDRVSYLNQTMQRILSTDNVSIATEEYLALVNESAATKTAVVSYIRDVDELIKLGNECSSALSDAELKVTTAEGREKLKDLKTRREAVDAMFGPPVNEKDIATLRAGLGSIKSQAEALALEEARPEATGPDYTTIGIAVAVLAVVGLAYWLFSSGKLPFGRKKKPETGQVAGGKAAEQPEVPQASAANAAAAQAPPARTAAPMVHYKVKLALVGGAYRTKIRSAVKDKNGNTVPDGTTVTFRADSGSITPSAVTKDGMVYASMAFKQKPGDVTVTVSAVGISRSIKIDFV